MSNSTKLTTSQLPYRSFAVYPETSKSGGVTVPEPLGEMMSTIEMMIANDSLDDEYIAAYDVVYDLLSCPAVALLNKAEEILLKIIDFNQDIEYEEEETKDMNMHRRIGFGNKTDNACDRVTGEVPTLITRDDISDEELLAEYEAMDKPENLIEE